MAKPQSSVTKFTTKPQNVVDRILNAEPPGRVFISLSVRSDLRDLFEEARKLAKTNEEGWFFQGTYHYVKNQEAEVIMSTVSVEDFGEEDPKTEEIEIQVTDHSRI